jgi:hypothetical protein
MIAEANWCHTSLIINLGNGKFEIKKLNLEAQFSSIQAIQIFDCNDDGMQDIIISANDYGYELTNGRMDASIGVILINEGNHNFKTAKAKEHGLYLDGDQRSLVVLKSSDGKLNLFSSASNGPIKQYINSSHFKWYQWNEEDKYLIAFDTNNRPMGKIEKYNGNTRLSQNSKHQPLSSKIFNIQVFNYKNESRKIKLWN